MSEIIYNLCENNPRSYRTINKEFLLGEPCCDVNTNGYIRCIPNQTKLILLGGYFYTLNNEKYVYYKKMLKAPIYYMNIWGEDYDPHPHIPRSWIDGSCDYRLYYYLNLEDYTLNPNNIQDVEYLKTYFLEYGKVEDLQGDIDPRELTYSYLSLTTDYDVEMYSNTGFYLYDSNNNVVTYETEMTIINKKGFKVKIYPYRSIEFFENLFTETGIIVEDN